MLTLFARRCWSTFSALACGILLCIFLPACSVVTRDTSVSTLGPRTSLDLNKNWRFIRQDVAGAQEAAFDDSAWQTISLPHTWNNLDGQDGGRNYYRGPAWYRRHVKLDRAAAAGKVLYLHFDAAASVADVYVNGRPAGSHRGNFGAFCFDVTKLLNASGDNLIAVKVNNAHTPDVPPLSGDFNICGGLYRGVQLLITDPLAITPLDDASPGVYIKQAAVSKAQADLEITIKVRNAGAAEKTAIVRCAIVDRDGNTAASLWHNKTVAPGATADVVTPLTLYQPHLWNGIKDPYMYQARVTVSDGPTVTDALTQPLGLRFYRVDPEQGFFLNGERYALHGVNRHQDRLDKGWAISAADREEDIRLIREMGCTVLRCCHYEHDQYLYDLCDRSGLVVWAELCLVDAIHTTPEFTQNAAQNLRELIKQNYNHPSICFWSLFNELNFPNVKPGADGPPPWDLIVQLNKQAKQLDPTRLTTAGTCRAPEHPVNFISDLVAFNWYYGWYKGQREDWASAMDQLHAKYPTRCIGFSEYGAGASVLQHEAVPVHPKTAGRWHPEEWQCLVHESAWNAMKDRPWIWGTFLWCMFDFSVDSRSEGDHLGRNDKGLVTGDRKIKKDAFYFYKANWSDEPVLYITDRRFTPRPAAGAPVKVYSNCPAVELKVNGQSYGTRTSSDHIFIWKDVALRLGDNAFEALGVKDRQPQRDACVIVGEAPAATKPASAP